MKGLGGLVQKNSAQIKKMGRSMTVAGGAIVGGLGIMVKAFGNFDEAMVRSLAIMGDVSPAMRKEMAKTAKQLSTESTFAAKELAEAYYFLASAGMSAEASVSALAPVARFAQAGAFDLAQATDLLTDAQTALGLSSEDVIENEKNLIRVSDVLVGANTLANASVLQFAEALTNKAAAAMVNVNKEVEEGVAVLAAYADKGVKGRLAGQRLTMMLNGLFAATRENKKAWDDVGISLWDAEGQMRSMGDIIADLEGYLGDMTPEMREAELATLGFNIKTKDSILTLLGSSEKIKTWTEKLKKMGGITKEVADKQLEAFNAKMTILKNTVALAAIEIGKSLAPMIEDLGVKIKTVTEEVTKWIEKHPEITEIISKSALGIGALLLVLGPLAMMLPGLVLGFKLLLPVVAVLASPITLLAAAIAGIAISAQKLADNLTAAKKAMSDFREETLIFKNAAENFKKLWIVVRKEGGETLKEFDELFKRFGGNWDMILGTIIKDPKFATLKILLFEIATGLKTISLEGKDLAITLPEGLVKAGKAAEKTKKVFTSWATGIGKIFRDTAVRIEEMKASFKSTSFVVGNIFGDLERGFVNINKAAVKAAKLPPFAVNIPKMSLEDFGKWFKKWLKDLQGKWNQEWEDMMWTVRTIVGQISGILGQLSANQMQLIDNEEQRRTDALNSRNEKEIAALESWYERERERIEATIINEEEKNEALEALAEVHAGKENDLAEAQAETQATLEEDIEKKRRKAIRKQAIFGKAVSLASAIINIAEAITKALTLGPFLGVAAATWVKALGAIQIAAIVAAPLPALQRGGKIGKAGIVGEAGPELFFPETPGTIVPLRTEATQLMTSPMIKMTFFGPLISTTGLARADLERAGNDLIDIIEMQARRRGYSIV